MTYQRTPGAYLPVLDLSVGEMVPPRFEILASNLTTVSQTLALTYFTADKTETITTLTAYTGTTAAGATPTVCRMGIYSIASNGDGTLIASTPNDTALFAATHTAYPKALSVSFVKQQGQRYATAILIVTAAAVPTLLGGFPPVTGTITTISALAPVRTGKIASQSDLPSTFVAASVSGNQPRPAVLLS